MGSITGTFGDDFAKSGVMIGGFITFTAYITHSNKENLIEKAIEVYNKNIVK